MREEFLQSLELEATRYENSLRKRVAEYETRYASAPMERIADKFEDSLEVAIRHGFAVGRATLKASWPNVSADAISDAVETALKQVLPATLLDILVAGGDKALDGEKVKRTLAKRDPFKVVTRFDQSDPHAIAWAKAHALELATGISQTSKKRLQKALAKALKEGGLEQLREEIFKAVGDVERAKLIAHNEVMIAANEGQRAGWRQASAKGLLDDDVRREWIGTPTEMCPRCAALVGQRAKLDGQYPGEGGDGPPLHVTCRCTEGLV